MSARNEAAVYRCPSCGAPNEPKAATCAYCCAEIHPTRCPWCFAWIDARARDCARCGSGAQAPAEDAKPLVCPTCRTPTLATRALGGARLSGCGSCGGVWADAASFKRLCEDRQTQAAYMGQGAALPRPESSDPSAAGIVYRPCPGCGELMNRFNFAGCSGVILDACKPHGVWFDADDLRSMVAFIRGGGLDVAREHERQELELERHRLEQAALPGLPSSYQPLDAHPIVSARGLLEHLLGFDEGG